MPGLDPIVLLDAILGRPDNIGHWQDELLAYASATAPAPQTKKEKPHVTPSDLPDRINPLVALRARALLRNSFGDLETAKGVLERLAELAGTLDETASDDPAGARPGRRHATRSARARQSALSPTSKK